MKITPLRPVLAWVKWICEVCAVVALFVALFDVYRLLFEPEKSASVGLIIFAFIISIALFWLSGTLRRPFKRSGDEA